MNGPADAIALETLDGLNPEEARALLQPADTALMHLPEIHLDPVQSTRLRQDQKLAGVKAAICLSKSRPGSVRCERLWQTRQIRLGAKSGRCETRIYPGKG